MSASMIGVLQDERQMQTAVAGELPHCVLKRTRACFNQHAVISTTGTCILHM